MSRVLVSAQILMTRTSPHADLNFKANCSILDMLTHCLGVADGDIYGSEGAYMRYEEGAGEGSDPYDQDVSSGRRHYRGRHSSARPAHSYGGYSDDDMDDDAYVTPETNPPLQVR